MNDRINRIIEDLKDAQDSFEQAQKELVSAQADVVKARMRVSNEYQLLRQEICEYGTNNCK